MPAQIRSRTEEAEEVAVRRLFSSLWFISLIFTGRLKNNHEFGLLESLNDCFVFWFPAGIGTHTNCDGTIFSRSHESVFAVFLVTSDP